eukprot:3597378-Heterocapsa_arctica.AAC.1
MASSQAVVHAIQGCSNTSSAPLASAPTLSSTHQEDLTDTPQYSARPPPPQPFHHLEPDAQALPPPQGPPAKDASGEYTMLDGDC